MTPKKAWVQLAVMSKDGKRSEFHIGAESWSEYYTHRDAGGEYGMVEALKHAAEEAEAHPSRANRLGITLTTETTFRII